MFRALPFVAIAAITLALAPAARAEWYIAKIGAETCVPFEGWERTASIIPHTSE